MFCDDHTEGSNNVLFYFTIIYLHLALYLILLISTTGVLYEHWTFRVITTDSTVGRLSGFTEIRKYPRDDDGAFEEKGEQRRVNQFVSW